MSKRSYATTAPTREEMTAAAIAALEAGVAEITNSDQFAAYLQVMSTFHTYSWGNALLIMRQRPNATAVAGYEAWKKLDRQVRKGERGIQIFVPYVGKKTDPDTGDESSIVRGFGIGYVFDVDQTDGEALPDRPLPQLLAGSSAIGQTIRTATVAFLLDEGVTLRNESHGNANGYYSPVRKEIGVDPTLSDDQTTKTLMHECAHYVADHRRSIPAEDAETVAESAAFVVLHHFGMDTSGYTFPYVANWAQDTAVLKRNLAEIQKTAHAIITALESRIVA